LDAIRHGFLTHAHLDHIAGVPMLIDANFDENFETPVTIYARKETIDALKTHPFNDVIWSDFSNIPSIGRAMLQYVTCNPGDAITIRYREFKAIDVSHSVPSLGYTVQSSGGVFAISGDSKTNETLQPALNACNDLPVLAAEVRFLMRKALATTSGHYSPQTLSRDLERL
jgi:cAMP phosphodiesterase